MKHKSVEYTKSIIFSVHLLQGIIFYIDYFTFENLAASIRYFNIGGDIG